MIDSTEETRERMLPSPDTRWTLEPAIAERLLGPAGLRLVEWLDRGEAQIVKNAPHRTIFRVRLPGLDFHLKHYRPHGLRGYVREMLRPPKARREHDLSAQLLAHGLPTPRPLGWGIEHTAWGAPASWILSETVPASLPLNAYLEEHLAPLPTHERFALGRTLSDALGALLARMHEAGVLHLDLHPGNLLVETNESTPRLWLIDLHAVRMVPHCTWRQARDHLALFNRYFILRSSRGDRLRFWRAYVANRSGTIPQPLDQSARSVERATEQSNREFWTARDRRCLENNRYYSRFVSGACRGMRVRDLPWEILSPWVERENAASAMDGVRVLKDSRSSRVLEFPIAWQGRTRWVVLKQFRLRNQLDPWLNLVRRSGALRSWILGQGLRERCLPTARPLAVWHHRMGGLPGEAYLLCEKIPDAVDLHEFVAHEWPPTIPATRDGRSRITALARLLRQMHHRGLSHRDLKASNLLTSRAGQPIQFWFIDLVGMRRHARVSRRRRMLNLARLNASFVNHPRITRTDKLRFLFAYFGVGLRGKCRWKLWWQGIEQATQAKQAQNLRRSRPLL